MRYTFHKWFWAWNYDKEEKWLNQMSAKGLQLVNVGFCKYVFEEGTPSEYGYKLELLEHTPSHFESIKYIQFLEEAEVEYIGSIMRWVYFRAKTNNKAFELYSDFESKIKHNNRILALFIAVFPVNFFGLVNNLNYYYSNYDNANLVIFILEILVCFLLSWGMVNIFRKNRKLKKKKSIQE